MGIEQIITDAFKKIANVGTTEEKNKLRREAKQCTLSEWEAKNRTKVVLMDAGSGIIGGPIGFALEGVDLAVLLRVCSRACYGIGYILDNKEINYDLP